VFLHITGQSVIIYTYCGLVIVFACVYVWAYHADKEFDKWAKNETRQSRHRTLKYEYEEEEMKVTKPKKRRVNMEVLDKPNTTDKKEGHMSSPPSAIIAPTSPPADESPASTIGRSNKDFELDIATRNINEPQPEEQSGQEDSSKQTDDVSSTTSRPNNDKRKTVLIKDAASNRFATKHKWISIYFSDLIDNLSRVARVTILLSMILTNMGVASVFFNSENQSSTAQKIIVGVIGSVISFVASLAIFTMFKLAPRRLSYSVSAVYIAGLAFLTLWYNLQLEEEQAYGWCTSSAIGIVQDALLNEPLKIVVISILVVSFPRAPIIKGM